MRGAKASVDGVCRQRSLLTHKKMIIFAHAHTTLKIDANIAHIIGKPARSRDWFVREALRLKVGDYVKQEMFPSDEFPAQRADSIDFHEAKMEGEASTLSHGGASTDSIAL
jgi:hypothetical protein